MPLKSKLVLTTIFSSLFIFVSLLFIPFVKAEDLIFPDPENYVSDFANVISASTENNLNEKLQNFEDETSNQIFVVSVTDYDDTYMEDYAVRLFEDWGIGQEKNDNGILLLFKPEAEAGSRVRIEVGYGLEGAVSDSLAGRILDNYFMDSYFEKDYDTAITQTVEQLMLASEGEYEGTGAEISEEFAGWVTIAPIVFFFIWSMLASTKSWWLGGLMGFIAGIIFGYKWLGVWGLFLLPIPFFGIGLLFDFIASKIGVVTGGRGIWVGGGSSFGGFSGGGGGGFSGGGGGHSGGGGASR